MILIYFLNRQGSARARWIVLSAFLLASPIALFMMIGGSGSARRSRPQVQARPLSYSCGRVPLPNQVQTCRAAMPANVTPPVGIK